MKELVSDLSKNLSVSEGDVLMLANSVINSIKQDKADGRFVELNENQRIDLVMAYVAHAVKKLSRFSTTYQVNPEARRTFQIQIFEMLKAEMQ